MTDLKPCAHCGGRARLSKLLSRGGELRGDAPSWDIECGSCWVWGRWKSEEQAIEAWNRRAPEAGGVPVAWRKRPNVKHPLFQGDFTGVEWRLSNLRPLLGEGSQPEWFDVQPLYASPVLPDREGVVALLSSADENGQIMGPQWVAETTSAILSPTTEGGEDE